MFPSYFFGVNLLIFFSPNPVNLLFSRSQRLREEIFHLIEKTSNDLRVQIDATNFDFRKRVYEMKRAKEELEYQMRKVK